MIGPLHWRSGGDRKTRSASSRIRRSSSAA
jgi:hypothetical protein